MPIQHSAIEHFYEKVNLGVVLRAIQQGASEAPAICPKCGTRNSIPIFNILQQSCGYCRSGQPFVLKRAISLPTPVYRALHGMSREREDDSPGVIVEAIGRVKGG